MLIGYIYFKSFFFNLQNYECARIHLLLANFMPCWIVSKKWPKQNNHPLQSIKLIHFSFIILRCRLRNTSSSEGLKSCPTVEITGSVYKLVIGGKTTTKILYENNETFLKLSRCQALDRDLQNFTWHILIENDCNDFKWFLT